MIVNKKPKIYSLYEIYVIMFYATMMFLMPLVLVFSYIFEIDMWLNINTFIFWLVISIMIISVCGAGVLLFKKDQLKRKVKPSYRKEFFYLVSITLFGLLGFIVFYDYVIIDRTYIANVLVVLFAILISLLIFLGRKFFKFDYMKKK